MELLRICAMLMIVATIFIFIVLPVSLQICNLYRKEVMGGSALQIFQKDYVY